MVDSAAPPFWKRKSLEEMTAKEWESLCDGCGRCCLVKLEEEENGHIHFTDVACRLFEAGTCRCSDYRNRTKAAPDCVKLTPDAVRSIPWLPPTCGYRLVAEGQDLPWWHPLISGTPDTVHEAGVSVRGKVSAFEDDMPEERIVDYIVKWPGRWPAGAKGAKRPVGKRTNPD